MNTSLAFCFSALFDFGVQFVYAGYLIIIIVLFDISAVLHALIHLLKGHIEGERDKKEEKEESEREELFGRDSFSHFATVAQKLFFHVYIALSEDFRIRTASLCLTASGPLHHN